EAGPEDAEDADEGGADGQVAERPEDAGVVADEAQALAQLAERRGDRLLGLADRARGREPLPRARAPRRSGARSAKPMASGAYNVSVKRLFAASSWRRSTRTGIIEASAGAKKTVSVETTIVSQEMEARW